MSGKADEVFTVVCGFGSAMTTDIIDGDMIVQISLQKIRPADFTLPFKQKMQSAG